jgi:hypothetical protein
MTGKISSTRRETESYPGGSARKSDKVPVLNQPIPYCAVGSDLL